MNKIIKIEKKYLRLLESDCFKLSSIILKRRINSFDNEFYYRLNNSKIRSKIFDSFNMSLPLQLINYQISKTIQNIVKKEIINWTYPQIRVDGSFAGDFTAPAHRDGWILNKNKKGYIVWFPLNKEGATLLISQKNVLKKIVKDKYWGIKAIGNISYKEKIVKYGEALVFDKKVLHKSKENQNRITIQCRYEEFNNRFQKRSVNQVIDPEVKKFWENNLF